MKCLLLLFYFASCVIILSCADSSSLRMIGKSFDATFENIPQVVLNVKEKAPYNLTGQFYGFAPLSLFEQDDQNNTIVNLPLVGNTTVWTATNKTINNTASFGGRIDLLNFTTILENGCRVTFNCYYFQNGGSMTFLQGNGEYIHSIAPDTFKFGAEIQNWPFRSTNNTLTLYIEFNSSAAIRLPVDNDPISDQIWVSTPMPRQEVTSSSSSSKPYDPCAPSVSKPPPLRGLDLRFLRFAELDGAEYDLFPHWYPSLPGVEDGTETFNSIHRIGHYFVFPHFNDKVSYDPDLTILLDGASGSDGDGGSVGGSNVCDGDGTTDGSDDGDGLSDGGAVGIAVGVTVAVVVVIAVVVGVGIFAAMKLKERERRNRISEVKHVQFNASNAGEGSEQATSL